MTEVRDKQKIFRGDSVLLPDGTVHEILKIQEVHNRYQLRGVSGWNYGIETLVLRPPGEAYRFWQDQAAVEKERADKAEQRAQVTDAMEAVARATGAALIEAEEREKKLREAMESIMKHAKHEGISIHLDQCYIEARDVLESLYPFDKEGETK